MAGNSTAPFSARNRGPHSRVDNGFPATARTGLIHLIYDLIEKQYIENWNAVATELQRIARIERKAFKQSWEAAERSKEMLMELPWERTYDFCERLYSRFPKAAGYWGENEWVETARTEDVRKFIASEMELLFFEENLAFEFRDGAVSRRGRKHTTDRSTKAELVLGDPKLAKARAHYEKALRYFRDSKKLDPQNSVKEAVCAVEAAARALFPEVKGATLYDVVKAVSGSDEGQIPKAIAKTFVGLYGFRGSGDGVAHGGSEGGPVTSHLAEYVLAVAASQIIYLVDLASTQTEDVPF